MFILVFRKEKWLVGDDLFYLKFWAKLQWPLSSKNADIHS